MMSTRTLKHSGRHLAVWSRPTYVYKTLRTAPVYSIYGLRSLDRIVLIQSPDCSAKIGLVRLQVRIAVLGKDWFGSKSRLRCKKRIGSAPSPDCGARIGLVRLQVRIAVQGKDWFGSKSGLRCKERIGSAPSPDCCTRKG